MLDLSGRTALVTGSNSGIGAAIVARLTAVGAHVIGVDRHAPDDGTGPTGGTIAADLTDPTAPAAIAAEVTGPVHVLVNNAGVAATRPWREVLAVNTLAPRDLTRALVPKLADGVSVVSIASQTGFAWRTTLLARTALLEVDDWTAALDSLAGEPDIDARSYTISKEAVIADMIRLAIARPVPGMRTNTVSPGTVDTPLLPDFRATIGEDAVNGAASWAGRHARPADIADVVAFLASDAARWVNGVDLPVDGGYAAQITTALAAAAAQGAGR